MTGGERRAAALLALGYLGFVSLGLPDGLLGVAWPSIRAAFDLPLDALAPLLVVATAGYAASSFSTGRVLSRIGLGTLLALSCVATAVSLLGYAATPAWWSMVALAALAGLGAGAIDAGINTYAATRHGPRTLNWLHAAYGIGAGAGPLVMTSVLGAGLGWRWGYGLVGTAQLVLAAAFVASRSWWPGARPGAAGPVAAADRPAARATLRLPAARLGIAAFFVYTGLELAVGVWAYSLLTEARGLPMHTAGRWVSVYWGSLVAGRIVLGAAAGVVPVAVLLRACVLGIAAGAALLAIDPGRGLGLGGLALIGLAAGPVFPSLMAATPARMGAAHTPNAVGFQVAAAALGQALLPAGIGWLAAAVGLEIVGPALLAAALVLLVVHEALERAAGARGGAPAPALAGLAAAPRGRDQLARR